MKKLTTEEFIERAQKIHKEKYNYSKVEYNGTHTKVLIICPQHGEFWQTPNHHLKGMGCPYCGGTKKLSKEEWIMESKKIHGDKYDYSKVKYVDNKTKVCIICPIHGEFWTTPVQHTILKQNCPKCAHRSYIYSKNEFIERAKKIHNNKYDYSKVEYLGNHKPICIICPKHGEFWQTPAKHINSKQGCPMCKQSKLERFVYNFLITHEVNFIYQANKAQIPWIGGMSLDFLLPQKQLAIECQGIQHFKPVDFGGRGAEYANEQFEKTQKRDIKKKDLCLKNGIKLKYILDFDEKALFNLI